MTWHKVLEGPDSIYRCPSCNSKHHGAVDPVAQRLLEVRGPREVVCKRCKTPMPWLNWRDYGITAGAFRMRQQRDRMHPPWEEKTPLWAIPTTEK